MPQGPSRPLPFPDTVLMSMLRWLDHLPPWLAWAAMLSTGVFAPSELVLMAIPLVLAVGVELRRLNLGPYEKWVNGGALAFAIALFVMRIHLIVGITFLLFLLCGVRLSLPRRLPQRRQLLLMGFLLFLVAALAVFSPIFGLWLILWLFVAGAILMQQAWEQGARHRISTPPFRSLIGHVAWAVLIAGILFLAMPRLAFGMRPSWLPGVGWGTATAGLSDRLDLGNSGPIQGNASTVLRIVPRDGHAPEILAQHLGLLRGAVLEQMEGDSWMPLDQTPRPSLEAFPGPSGFDLDFFLTPGPLMVVPQPYGVLQFPQRHLLPLTFMEGGALRLRLPSRQAIRLPLHVRPASPSPLSLLEAPPTGRRQRILLDPGDTEFARRWGQEAAPLGLPPSEAAEALSRRLQQFSYTLDNPSGTSRRPLEDFLLRTQAGHCEYFASALAVMLRHRGIPARVVNGYRLGTWVKEGGYFLVTENEAHSWVEYYDESHGVWQAADPTPSAPEAPWSGDGLLARLRRWSDALEFMWDRHVVRFSDSDQLEALSLLNRWVDGLKGIRAPVQAIQPLGWAALAILLARLAWRWHRRARAARGMQAHLPELRPLLRAVGVQHPPAQGDSARTWLTALASRRLDRASELTELAELADQVAYGRADSAALKRLVALECRAWKKDPATR